MAICSMNLGKLRFFITFLCLTAAFSAGLAACHPPKKNDTFDEVEERPDNEWVELAAWVSENDVGALGKIDSLAVDLNADGEDELILCFPAECGTAGNCFWYILLRKDGQCKEIGFVDGSIEILSVATDDFRDISASWHLSGRHRSLSTYRFKNGFYRLDETFECRIDEHGQETCIPVKIPADSTSR